MKLKPYIIALGVFILTFSLFFYKPLFSREVFYCCDNFNYNVPFKNFLVATIQQYKEIPLWNPHILSGTPFFADITTGVLSMTNVLYFLTTPFRALTWSILFDFAVCFWGMIILVHSLFRRSLASALVSASVYTFSGVMIDAISNVASLHTACLVPWTFAMWAYCFQKPSVRRCVLAVIALVIQFFSGHPQVTYYIVIVSLAYVFFVSRGPVKDKFVWVLVIGSIALLMSMVQLLPFLEFARESTRFFLGEAYATSGALTPTGLIRFILPKAIGVINEGTVIAQMGSIVGYIGVIPLLFILYVRIRDSMTRFFFVIAGVCLLASFGNTSPIYQLLYTVVPFFRAFRSPQQLLFIYSFSGAILTGFFMDTIRLSDDQVQLQKKVILTAVIFGIGAVVVFLFSPAIVQFLIVNREFLPTKVVTKLHLPSPTIIESVLRYVTWNAAFVTGVCVTLYLALKYAFGQGVWKSIVLVVVIAELWFAGSGVIQTTKEMTIQGWINTGQDTTQSMEGLDRSQDRIYVPIESHAAPRQKIYGVYNEYEEEEWQARILRQNVHMWYGLSSVDGYASMVYSPYQNFFNTNTYEPTGLSLRGPYEEKIASVSGRFILGKEDSEPKIIRNDAAVPRMYVRQSDGTHGQVTIIKDSPNHIAVMADTKEDSKLVMMQVRYPGWHAAVDGKSARIDPYLDIFQSVELTKGTHVVDFSYFPDSVRWGTIGTGIGFGILIIMIFLGQTMGKKRWNHRYILIPGIGVLTYIAFSSVLDFGLWKDDWINYWGATVFDRHFLSDLIHPGTIAQFLILSHWIAPDSALWQVIGLILRAILSLTTYMMVAACTKSQKAGIIAGICMSVFHAGLDAIGWVSGQVVILDGILINTSLYLFTKVISYRTKKMIFLTILAVCLTIVVDPGRTFPLIILGSLYHLFRTSVYKRKQYLLLYAKLFGLLLLIITIGLILNWHTVTVSSVYSYIITYAHDPMRLITALRHIGAYLASIGNLVYGWIIPLPDDAATGQFLWGSYLAGCVLFILLISFFRSWIIHKDERALYRSFFLLYLFLFYLPNWLFEPRLTMASPHRYMLISGVGFIALLAYELSRIRSKGFLFLVIGIFIAVNMYSDRKTLSSYSLFRSKGIVDAFWSRVQGETASDPNQKIFLVTGGHPIFTRSIDYSGSAPYAVFTKLQNRALFPLYVTSPMQAVPYLCDENPVMPTAGGSIILDMPMRLSSVYAWNIGRDGTIRTMSEAERSQIRNLAEDEGCLVSE